MEENKYIFLDIDGVVNTLMIYKEPVGDGRGTINREGYYYIINNPSDKLVSNKKAVILLDKLCRDTGAKIVISSTWRRGHYNESKEALYNSGLGKDIEIVGKTPINDECQRGGEIEMWFNQNQIDMQKVKFVILDDDSDMMGLTQNLQEHLILCPVYDGFGWKEFNQCIDILGEKEG